MRGRLCSSLTQTAKARFLHIIHFLLLKLSYNHRMINGCIMTGGLKNEQAGFDRGR